MRADSASHSPHIESLRLYHHGNTQHKQVCDLSNTQFLTASLLQHIVMFTHEFVTHSSALSSAAKLPSTETFSPAHSHQFASLRDTPNTRKPVTTFPALAVITSRRVVHCVHFIIMTTHNSENKFSSHKFGHIMVLTRPMQQHSAS